MKKTPVRFFVGIDEVGRGPLAGPVAVGVAMASEEVIRKFKKIKESKQLTRTQREEWYKKICLPKSGIKFTVSFISAPMIDKQGINPSIRKAVFRSLKKLSPDPMHVRVLLDGGLQAPREYLYQTTIIHGDAKETIIAIASVVAKVERDRHMIRMHKKYPAYCFDRHVGYGTKAHITAIKKHGLTPLHRVTFCKKIMA